ncbi:MAG: c-type cytochrome [Deltaproteobacteria bacterium]|nr:c-type cytochrome [Deltaproteobacteria bacterium]
MSSCIVGFFVLGACLIGSQTGFAGSPGKEIFQQRCSACHSIGQGLRVGPDLAGVNDRHSEGWLLKFIKSPQAVINSGDPSAKALFEEFKMVMPDQALTDLEIKAIMSHIKEVGGNPASAPSAPRAPSETVVEATPNEIELGQNLFQGKVRFANGGPSCISCHHVRNDAVIGGGILAKELTTVFSRMGGEGVRAILGGPPFPVMQAAYKGMPFTEGEIRALVGFLQNADKEHAYQHPRDYGWGLFGAGAGGLVVLLGFYSVVGRRRKKRPVNQDIYDRQIKSE